MMDTRDIMDMFLAAVALSGLVYGGRIKMKDAIIKDLSRIVDMHRDERELQDQKIVRLEKRVEFLEQMLGGNSGLVPARAVASPRRRRRGSGTADDEDSEDRDL